MANLALLMWFNRNAHWFFLAILLVAFILIKVFISALYAKGHTKAALKISVICIICNILLILILKTHDLGYLALAISTMVTPAINALLLYLRLKRITHVCFDLTTLAIIIRVIIASSLMFLILHYLKQDMGYSLALGFKTSFLNLFIIIGIISISTFSYFVCLFLVGVS